jgi:integrase
MASISDRWHVTDSLTGRRHRSARFGTGKRWQVRYRDLDGSSRNRSFERKADAERYLVQLSSQLMAGSYVDPRAGRVPVGVYVEEWFARQTYGPTSREAVRHRLNAYVLPAWRDVPLVNVRANDVQAWIRHLQESLAASTVRQVFITFSAVMSAASAEGLIGPNPTKAAVVRLPAIPTKRVHPWTADRVELVLEAIPDRYRLAAVVAAGCGLRQGECFGLRLEDVDFERREIHVRQQVVILNSRPTITAPKYGRTRSVPAPDWVLAAVRSHVAQWPPLENGLLAYGRERKPLNKNYFNTAVWRPALDAAGIPRGRTNGMHVLRHTCASLWLEHGVSIKAVSEYLGHADPGFTLRVYTHVMPASGERARNAMDEAFRKGRPRPEERHGQRGRTHGARAHDESRTTTESNGQR